jgi:hypothetical protein
MTRRHPRIIRRQRDTSKTLRSSLVALLLTGAVLSGRGSDGASTTPPTPADAHADTSTNPQSNTNTDAQGTTMIVEHGRKGARSGSLIEIAMQNLVPAGESDHFGFSAVLVGVATG